MTKNEINNRIIAHCLELRSELHADIAFFGESNEMTCHTRAKWAAVYELIRELGLENAYIKADLKKAMEIV